MNWKSPKWSAAAVAVLCVLGVARPVSAQCTLTPPANILPLEGATVTSPPSFGWSPGQNNTAIYLNVSTSPSMSPIDVINWRDDGKHHFTAPQDFSGLAGRTLYWRLVADGCGQRVITPVRSFRVGDVSIDPHYNLVHFAWPTGESTWPLWKPDDLTTFKVEDLHLLRQRVGTGGATPDRKLAYSIHVPFFYWRDLGPAKLMLQKIFEVSTAADMPVLIGLDGFEYWNGRPDLWNWWDPGSAGYNDANRYNVEWTSWSPLDAVTVGWRNWGRAVSAEGPHPNIASPQVLEATRAALRELAPLIRDWHNSLPASRKHLLVGVKVGWEVSIGVNYFYPVASRGGVCPPSGGNQDQCMFQRGRQVGYAAVSTAGIRQNGTLTDADLTQVVRTYVTELTKAVYESGIPRSKIFTHVGPVHVGDDAWGQQQSPPLPRLVRNGADAALSPHAHAGWSFYTGDTGAAGVKDLGASLGSLASTGWGLVEWGGPGTTSPDMVAQQLDGYFAHQHNKLVAAYFCLWSPVPGVDCSWHATGLNRVLSTGVTCWMHPPVGRAQVSGTSATLSWSVPGRAQELYLNVTTDPRPSLQGGFVAVNVFNARVTGTSQRTFTGLAAGTYYWKLFADGCGRRVISDLGTFVVP